MPQWPNFAKCLSLSSWNDKLIFILLLSQPLNLAANFREIWSLTYKKDSQDRSQRQLFHSVSSLKNGLKWSENDSQLGLQVWQQQIVFTFHCHSSTCSFMLNLHTAAYINKGLKDVTVADCHDWEGGPCSGGQQNPRDDEKQVQGVGKTKLRETER